MLAILLDNALAYTPPGGRVTVGVPASGQEVIVTVTDTGAGIARETPFVNLFLRRLPFLVG